MGRHAKCASLRDPLTRGIMNIVAVPSNSLRKYILSVITLVEDEIKKQLQSKFGVIFDGWSDSSM